MERKFRFGRWKMREWNGMEDFKNGMEDNLPFFHTNSILDFVHCISQKYIPISGGDKYIVTEVFNLNIYACYLSTNCGTLVVYIAQTVYVLHHCKYIAICSIDVIIDNFDRFHLIFLFEVNNLPSPKFCFLTSSRKLVFAISFPF